MEGTGFLLIAAFSGSIRTHYVRDDFSEESLFSLSVSLQHNFRRVQVCRRNS